MARTPKKYVVMKQLIGAFAFVGFTTFYFANETDWTARMFETHSILIQWKSMKLKS